MMTLYGTKGSGSAAVEAALRLAGQPFQLVDAASWVPTPGLEKLKRVNPLVQVPTLVLDDESVMTESAAILIWLGLRYPQSGLLPSEPSQAIRGLVYIAANSYAAIGIIDYPARFCAESDEATAKRIQAGTRTRLHEYWRIFADTFPAVPFLTGDHLGALDLLAAVVSRWSGARALLQSERPAFHSLMQRIETDRRVADIFERHWPGT
jgi:GST-like protein